MAHNPILLANINQKGSKRFAWSGLRLGALVYVKFKFIGETWSRTSESSSSEAKSPWASANASSLARRLREASIRKRYAKQGECLKSEDGHALAAEAVLFACTRWDKTRNEQKKCRSSSIFSLLCSLHTPFPDALQMHLKCGYLAPRYTHNNLACTECCLRFIVRNRHKILRDSRHWHFLSSISQANGSKSATCISGAGSFDLSSGI